MQLLASNRLVTLQQYLSLIPHDVFRSYPWISFFHGVICLGVAPPEALAYLENARSGFIQQQDEIGELVALIQLIFFHTAIDCQFKQGQPLLLRAICLYEKHKQSMEKGQQAHAANIIVIGLTFFETDIERTKSYADFGLGAARQSGHKNLEAEARLARCYRDIFAGRLLDCRQEIEKSLALLTDPQVSLVSKSTLQLAQLNLLANEGESDSYEYHRRLYLAQYGEAIVEQSSFGPIMRLWEIDLALARGDITEAETILKEALELKAENLLEHIKSFYLQYHAYLRARQGRSEESLVALQESLDLRQRIGGNEFIIYNCMLLGTTYGRLGRTAEAMKRFELGLEMSEQTGELFMRPAVYAHRAWINLKQGELQSVSSDIRNMFECLQKTGFRSFYGWDPEVMSALFTEAVQRKIKPEFSRELARTRLGLVIGDDGKTYPLMHFSILEGLRLTCQKSHLSNTDITRSMRDLLTMLIMVPDHQLDQEYIQNELWPEEPPARGRSNFDNLISRTRKLIKQAFPQVDAKMILPLRKGVLALQNCSIDLDVFRQSISQGLSYAGRQKSWQAMNALRQGLKLCSSSSCGDHFLRFDLGEGTHEISALYFDGSCEYGRLLAKNGQIAEAVTVLQKAVRQDPTHEPSIQQLYELMIQQGNSPKAHQVYQDYRAALQVEGYPDEEIERTLEKFWSRPLD